MAAGLACCACSSSTSLWRLHDQAVQGMLAHRVLPWCLLQAFFSNAMQTVVWCLKQCTQSSPTGIFCMRPYIAVRNLERPHCRFSRAILFAPARSRAQPARKRPYPCLLRPPFRWACWTLTSAAPRCPRCWAWRERRSTSRGRGGPPCMSRWGLAPRLQAYRATALVGGSLGSKQACRRPGAAQRLALVGGSQGGEQAC